MSFLIDSDICSAYLKDNRAVVTEFDMYPSILHVSTLTVGELHTWASHGTAPPKRMERLNRLLAGITILDVTVDIARRFGTVRAGLIEAGIIVQNFNLMIASTALVYDLAVVTHNVAHFARVPGLRIVDWMT